MSGGVTQMRVPVFHGGLAGLGLRAAAAFLALAPVVAGVQLPRSPVARADASGRGGDIVPLTPSGQLVSAHTLPGLPG